jgi:hypothetical protein
MEPGAGGPTRSPVEVDSGPPPGLATWLGERLFPSHAIVGALEDGEAMLWTGRPRLTRCARFVLESWALMAFAVWFAVRPGWVVVALTVLLVVLAVLGTLAERADALWTAPPENRLVLLAQVALLASTRYAVTSRRVIIARGLSARRLTAIRLATLADVSRERHLHGGGTVFLHAPGVDPPPPPLSEVADADAVCALIRDARGSR